MFLRVLLLLVVIGAYIFLLTVIFEYCINEASSTLLTTVGILLFLLCTALLVPAIRKIIKT